MKKLLVVLAAVAFANCVEAQKIKYKDLFPLLEAKDYEMAEPQLRQFLSDEKNREEANAIYQFATMFDQYFQKGDLVNDTENVMAMADSAILFYEKSIELIDDRELRKNDEYYQSFYRRDLRTGDFGIKLSDVHLDIEKKIERIEAGKKNFETFGQLLESINSTEESLVSAFNDLVGSYDSYNDFLLSAGNEEITILGTLTDFQNKIEENTNELAVVALRLGIRDKYQDLELVPVPGFEKLQSILGKDGNLKCYDLEDWAYITKGKINSDIITLKSKLGVANNKLAVAKSEMTDGVSSSFPPNLPPDLRDLIEKYDEDSPPADLIYARTAENIVLNLSDTILNEDWSDSSLVAHHANVSDSIVKQILRIQELTDGLGTRILDSRKYYDKLYNEQYGSLEEAVAYSNTLAGWATEQLVIWDTIKAFWNDKNAWGMIGEDLVPLSASVDEYEGDYKTLGTWKIGEYDMITYGIKLDSMIGFVARFGVDRKAKWQLRFESGLFDSETVPELNIGQIESGEQMIAFYLHNPAITEGENITFVSFMLEGGLNWDVDVAAEQQPVNTEFDESIRQHTIYYYPEDQYPLSDGRLGYLVINRNGEAQ